MTPVDGVRVLRSCEAVTSTAAGQERCSEPGQVWEAPNGKSYVVCAGHGAMFDPSMGGAK